MRRVARARRLLLAGDGPLSTDHRFCDFVGAGIAPPVRRGAVDSPEAPSCAPGLGQAAQSGEVPKSGDPREPFPLSLRNQGMAAGYQPLIDHLQRFYDFAGKAVLLVGAGSGRLLSPAVKTNRIIAVDRDAGALARLKTSLHAKGMRARVETVCARFEDLTAPADVVYFEFCLHEMADPEVALSRARTLAPDIVVYDHSAGSEWSFHAAEDEKICRSSAAVERFGIRRRDRVPFEQRFKTHAELLAKLTPQGPAALRRAQPFAGASNIVIPMPCDLLLL